MAAKKQVLTAEKEVSASVALSKEVIQLLSVDCSREDLNSMRDKINEIVTYINEKAE